MISICKKGVVKLLKNLDLYKIKNFIIMFVSNFLGKFIGIITIGIISRNIFISDKGLYDYYNVIVTYLILLINFGFELYFMELNLNRKISTEYLFTAQVKARGGISIVIITTTILGLFISGNLTSKTILLILLMLKLFSYTFDLSWNLQIDEKFNKLAKYNFMNSIIKLILVFLIIRGNNIIGLVLIDVILDFLLKINIYLNYKYKLQKKVPLIDIINIIKKSFVINLSSFMISIYYSVDTLMLGMFRTSKEVAIYTGAYNFLTMAIVPTTILYQIYSPQLVKNRGNRKVLKKYIGATSLLGILVFIGCVLIGPIAIKIILGQQYYSSADLFRILSIDLIPCYLAGAFANPINSWGFYKDYFKIVMCGGIFNIIANLIFVKQYGYYGAVVTTIVSEFIVFMVAAIWWFRNIKRVGVIYEGNANT